MKIKEQTRKLSAGCSKHCFEVADKTCEASILSLCSLFKLQRWPMWTETMFPLSATSNSLLDCWSYAGVGRLKRFGEPFQPFLYWSSFPLPLSYERPNSFLMREIILYFRGLG